MIQAAVIGRLGRAVAVTAIVLGMARWWPHAPLKRAVPLSTGVWSADGELLRVTRSADDQFRLWVPLSQVSPALVDAFLLKEDRWFYLTPGVNPVALARAAIRTYRAGARQGGSTVTMQVARIVYRLNTRTVPGKLRQVAAALWLEARYSKRELLETYLNLVPFGGNLQGVGAASRMYFGKPPNRLTPGEALTLAVIPQRPASRVGRSPSDERLLAARTQLAMRMTFDARLSCRLSRDVDSACRTTRLTSSTLFLPAARIERTGSTRPWTLACRESWSGRSIAT